MRRLDPGTLSLGFRNWVTAGVAFVTALIVFGLQANRCTFPPGNDTTYYLLGAQSLAQGRGMHEDVIWHYLKPPTGLPQPGNDYWMPMTSWIIAPSLRICGDTYRAALVPIVVLAALAAAQCFLFGSVVLRSRAWGLTCSGVFILSARVLGYATSTDSAIPYSVFVLTVFWMYRYITIEKHPKYPVSILLLGVAAAAAVLTRGDALFVLPAAVVICIALSHISRAPTPPARLLALASAVMVVCLLPWVLRNLHVFGTPWNPATSRAALLTQYSDLYVYGKTVAVQTFLHHLRSDPIAVAKSKVWSFLMVWRDFGQLLPSFTLPFMVLGLAIQLRQREILSILAFSFLLALACGYGLLSDAVGGYYHSMLALMPFAIVTAARGFQSAVTWGADTLRRSGHRSVAAQLRHVMYAAVITSLTWTLCLRIKGTEDSSGMHQRIDYETIRTWLDQHGYRSSDAILSVRPWQVRYATGHPAVMLPSNGLAAICAIAQKYDVKAVLLDGYYLDTRGYEDMRQLYQRKLEDPRFELQFETGAWKLYRIDCAAAPKRSG